MDERRILSVSELTSTIRECLEGRFSFVSVAGEISNLHRPASGHLYFTLKDAGAQIRAVLFKMQQRYLAQMPKDGTRVVCRGRISVYEPRGEYQLIVDTLTVEGAGALHLAFEQLKRRLAAEGLFDEHLKRPLPPFPTHLTLITAPQGAAVHDFLRIASRRLPGLRIAVFPATMQGQQASIEIIRAIEAINAKAATEFIVLCRGGGSVEDLWAFNDEALARAIRASALPVVSAVGHEVDFTIADFAADLRAPTPSGAAELVVPDGAVLRAHLHQQQMRLQRGLHHRLKGVEQRLRLARQRLATMPHPLERLLLHLDHLAIRLEQAQRTILTTHTLALRHARHRLTLVHPQKRLERDARRLSELWLRLQQQMRFILHHNNEQLGRVAGILQAVSPLATLARGYAIVRTTTKSPRIITVADQAPVGTQLEILLHRGRLRCEVEQQIKENVQENCGEEDSSQLS